MIVLPEFLADLVPSEAGNGGAYGPPPSDRPRPYRPVVRCRWCRAPFTEPIRAGRPAVYCRFDRLARIRKRVERRVRRSFVT